MADSERVVVNGKAGDSDILTRLKFVMLVLTSEVGVVTLLLLLTSLLMAKYTINY